MKFTSKFVILNTETGELLPLTQEVFNKVREPSNVAVNNITPKDKEVVAPKAKPRMTRLSRGSFIYLIVNDNETFMDNTPSADLARLTRLALRLNWQGELPINSFDVKFLQKELDVTQDIAYQLIRCIKSNLGKTIAEVNTKLESVFFRGSPKAFKTFGANVRGVKLYSVPYVEAYDYDSKRSRAALGCLLKLAPYINKYSNVLCKNVDLKSIETIQPLDTSEMADILSVDIKILKERILPTWKKMLINTNGEMCPVVKNIGGLYVVNPALLVATKYDAPVWEYFLGVNNKEE